jgi:hypothetical protein
MTAGLILYVRGEDPLRADKLNASFSERLLVQWVPAMAVPASIGEAPSNGSVYARQSGQWTDIGTTSLSKNLLHNSLFNIAQRGAGAFTTNSTYTLDRWVLGVALDTASIVRFNTTDADKAAIGDEAAVNYLQNSFTGNAGASASNYIEQRIEGVRRLSGKTVTVSFWAVGTGPKLGVNMYQLFGSGGSPSAYVQALVWGVQLEIGNIATALEKLDPQQDLAKCQRFYQIGNLFLNGYQTISNSIGIGSLLPVPMRATPTVSVGPNNNSSGIGAITFGAVANATVYATGIASATGACSINTNFVASADL